MLVLRGPGHRGASGTCKFQDLRHHLVGAMRLERFSSSSKVPCTLILYYMLGPSKGLYYIMCQAHGTHHVAILRPVGSGNDDPAHKKQSHEREPLWDSRSEWSFGGQYVLLN